MLLLIASNGFGGRIYCKFLKVNLGIVSIWNQYMQMQQMGAYLLLHVNSVIVNIQTYLGILKNVNMEILYLI